LTEAETAPKFPNVCPLEKSIGSVCSCFDDPPRSVVEELPVRW
jgi:hypothetical protein